jgi:hypothetical protein
MRETKPEGPHQCTPATAEEPERGPGQEGRSSNEEKRTWWPGMKKDPPHFDDAFGEEATGG